MLLLAKAAALAAGSPVPQDPNRVYSCPKIVTTGGTSTPPVTIGTQSYPTISATGFDPGTRERLVCSVGGAATTSTGAGTAVVIGESSRPTLRSINALII